MEILPQLLANSLITGSIYALLAVGLSLQVGILRVFNFAHGHLMMLGAYIFYACAVEAGFSVPASAALLIPAMIVLSLIAFLISVVPFARYGPLLTLVSTLALSYALESLISMQFGVNVKTLPVGELGDSFEWGSVFITPLQLIIIVSALCIVCFISWFVHRTPWGRKVRAVAQDVYASEALGLNDKRLARSVFILSTLLAAYTGVLVGYETNLQPTMGIPYTVKALAAMIMGGVGNMWGAVAGAYLLGAVENLSIGIDVYGYSIPAGYKDAFAYMVILLMLLFRPQGLFGSVQRKV